MFVFIVVQKFKFLQLNDNCACEARHTPSAVTAEIPSMARLPTPFGKVLKVHPLSFQAFGGEFTTLVCGRRG